AEAARLTAHPSKEWNGSMDCRVKPGNDEPLSARQSLQDLGTDRGILDLVVLRQQKRLRQDDREHRIALERQAHMAAGVLAILNDAQILLVGLHLDVSRAEMDAVAAQLALDDEVALLEAAPRRD